MKSTKRSLALILVILIIASIIPMSAFAAGTDDITTNGVIEPNKVWFFGQSGSSYSVSQTILVGYGYTPETQVIKIAQAALKYLGYYTGAVDGVYGPLTNSATYSYQSAKGLSVDGVIGSQTWCALEADCARTEAKLPGI